ncbi:MAG: right-handed parallel beta-helix repeat-containing protein, partial [Deltaproteobacteria bacterium]
ITNCTFSGNSAKYGGGIFNNWYSLPTITNCTFISNQVINDGGGVYNDNYSSPLISNCIFTANQASNNGGGLYNWNSSPEITNCTFSDNQASNSGGGIYNFYSSSPTITNCIMWDNTAPIGPEIALYSTALPSILTISYSDVQGGPTTGVYVDPGCTLNWGAGMIGELPEDDPLFETGPGGNYYLRQPPDQSPPISPCVDAGSDTAVNLGMDDKTTSTNGDLDSGWVDMGYHYEP